MKATSKQLCTFYFTPRIPNDDGSSKNSEWDCNKCGKTKMKSGGWTNLLNHARSCVGVSFQTDYEALHAKTTKPNSIASFVLRINDTERDMYKWVEWVVMLNQPLSIVDNPLTREGMRYKPVTSKLLRKNILALGKEVRASIKKKLPNKFSIVFDGWSEGTVHYIGVSAAYVMLIDSQEVVVHTLLSMRPLLADDINGMKASDHINHLLKMLSSYGKTDTNIVCLVGDNCSVNQSMSKILKVPLIGCGSHKFNLAIRKWISNQPGLEDIIQKVALVMKKASTLKVSAQLRKLTSLHTVKANDTRWSSTFEMCARFFRIQSELSAVDDLIPLIPSLYEVDTLCKGFKHLSIFNDLTIMLQKEGITFLRVREIFDTILEDYPELSGHLGPASSIIVDVAFEMAVTKIAKGQVLSEEERECVKRLLRQEDEFEAGNSFNDEADEGGHELSYLQKFEARIKKRKLNDDDIASQYINLGVLAGTSVSCERLFSAAKHILTDTRKCTSPAVFEAILLLKVNRSEWDVHSMGRAMGQTIGTRLTVNADADIIIDSDTDEDPDLFYAG